MAEHEVQVRVAALVGRSGPRRLRLRRSRLVWRGCEWQRHAQQRDQNCDLHTLELFHKRPEVSYIPGMAVDPELLEILACPNCKTPVTLVKNGTALKCATCKRVYPIKDDIPVMLIDEATIDKE
jgi:uncharacterized protein YbaR (Trm112 family)